MPLYSHTCIIVFLLMFNALCCLSSRILIVSIQLPSHIEEKIVIGEELVHRGHEVYLVLKSDYQGSENYEKRGINLLWYDYAENDDSDLSLRIMDIVFNNSVAGLIQHIGEVSRDGMLKCQAMFQDLGLMNKITKLDFQMALVDFFPFSLCHYLLPHMHTIPFVSVTGLGITASVTNVPSLFSFVPPPLGTLSHSMTLLERMQSFWSGLMSFRLLSFILVQNATLLQQYGVDAMETIVDKSLLFISLRDHILEFPAPAMPNFIALPGITTRDPLPIEDANIKSLADSATNGLIVMTFGSIIKHIPMATARKYMDAFSKVNQTILCRLSMDTKNKLSYIPPNVVIKDWLPQNDVLGHKNTKLFITHCGQNGQYESIYNGVPMLGFPIFGDHHHNCFRAQYHNFGRHLDILTFTVEELVKAINDIPENDVYRKSVKKASRILQAAALPRVQAADVVEHVIQFGGDHLRSAGQDLHPLQYWMVDCLLLSLALVALAAGSTIWIIKASVNKCRKVHKKQKKQ